MSFARNAASVAAAIVAGRASWWALHNFLLYGHANEAFWPWRHLVCYTLPAAFLGLEAVVLTARVFHRSPPWPWAWHATAAVCALWMMHWADALRGVVPHMNTFDRAHYFGNTIWLWLLEPASLIMLFLAARDLATRPR